MQASDFSAVDPAWARLGQLLFYDPILSGNRNISCGTCHNQAFGGSDGMSLGIGEGGVGVGPARRASSQAGRIRRRVPRNAPAIWNLGAKQVRWMFLDGRVSRSNVYGNGFDTPAGEWLPKGLSGILAAQALFPMAAQFEMAGDPDENRVARAAYDRIDRVWPILAQRVRAIPEYARMFAAAFDDVKSPSDITISHIANAIAAFEAFEWRSIDSPFDAYLRGDLSALNPTQQRGRALFYGRARCSGCHSGPLLSDQSFHALALPQFGPGRTGAWDVSPRDVGRMAASDRLEDAYRFKTPQLRNVALTAPYGHDGAYPTLAGIVRHHLDPTGARARWDRAQAQLPPVPWLTASDFLIMDDRAEQYRLGAKIDIIPVALSGAEVDELVAFLNSLTGTKSIGGRLGRPASVPSGLKVD